MGISIDRRLEELGGKRSLALCCADEATGLEEFVEPWKRDIMAALSKIDDSVALPDNPSIVLIPPL